MESKSTAMASRWYISRRRGLRYQFVAFFLYLVFLFATAITPLKVSKAASRHDSDFNFVDQTGNAVMARIGSMRTAFFALASSALVAGQNATSYAISSGTSSASPTTDSVITATVDGVATTFSNQFTIPAKADIGPNLLPNVQDPQAVKAQDVCPGYTASEVEKTANGFTAILSLAGEPVGTREIPGACQSR